MGIKAFGQLETWNMDILHTEGTLARFAVEMNIEDLAEALDDECHLLIVEFGGVYWLSPWCSLLLFLLRCLECNGLGFGCGGIVKLVDLPRAFDLYCTEFSVIEKLRQTIHPPEFPVYDQSSVMK